MNLSIPGIFTPLASLCLCLPMLCIAEPAAIDYNAETDLLTVSTNGAYLDELLTGLAQTIDFKLDIEDQNLHRPINLTLSGDSKTVLTKLINPNSAAISQSDIAPYKVTRLILLPAGNTDSLFLPRKSLSPPISTGDEGKDEKHMKHYERKLRQASEGPIGPRRGERLQLPESNRYKSTIPAQEQEISHEE